MTAIAITGFPKSYQLHQVFFLLKPVIRGHFEVLNFDPKLRSPKTCYVRISENLDPQIISTNINKLKIGPYRLYAYMPPAIPKLKKGKMWITMKKPLYNQNYQPSRSFKAFPVNRTSKIPVKAVKVKKTIRAPNIQPSYNSDMIITFTHEQILLELQSRYPGLYNLNKNTGNGLLLAIGQTVHKRLKEITKSENAENCKKLSRLYRILFPHSGDFQLISTTLHRIQDEMGNKRLQIQQKDLMAVTMKPYALDKISPELIQDTSQKYSEKITASVVEHVKNLSTTLDPSKDPLEEAARIKVKEQLKNMMPYFPGIIKNVVSKHLVIKKNCNYIVKIYGEPALPSKPMMNAWMRRYKIISATRSERMYNLLLARTPAAELAALLAADGTVMGGSKLTIRQADTPYIRVPICNK